MMSYIKLTATVKGAVTISSGPLVGNQLDTASWISGSVLRGALAAHWGEVTAANEEEFLDLFCRGSIGFHGLFPLPSDPEERADFLTYGFIPWRVPQAFYSCKYQPWTDGLYPHKLVNKAIKFDCNSCRTCGASLKQTKSPDFYYSIDEDGKDIKPIKQKKETYLYHGTDRNTKRAEDGALYSYTSIQDGEGFIGWLSGEKNALEKLYKGLFASPRAVKENGTLIIPLSVGRAKKRRGYLEIEIHQPRDNAPAMLETPKHDPRDNIVVVLQTPAILHDSCFRHLTTLEPGFLFPGQTGISKCDSGEFSSMTLVEGWSGIHRLPRNPVQALAAGSTFVFKKEETWTDDMAKVLAELHQHGIGERRLEGYGRIAVNPPPMAG